MTRHKGTTDKAFIGRLQAQEFRDHVGRIKINPNRLNHFQLMAQLTPLSNEAGKTKRKCPRCGVPLHEESEITCKATYSDGCNYTGCPDCMKKHREKMHGRHR